MSALEEYEKRFQLEPLTVDEILAVVDQAEDNLQASAQHGIRTTTGDRDRVVVWLHERLLILAGGIDRKPEMARCAWCLRAGGSTQEAWTALPKLTLDDAAAHSTVCDHNPLVQRNRVLLAEVLELRASMPGNQGWRQVIRALLKSDMPAGELRKALAELVG